MLCMIEFLDGCCMSLQLILIIFIWIIGSVFTLATCGKNSKNKCSETVEVSQPVLGKPSTNFESKTVFDPYTQNKKTYETANDIANEMSLRHADMMIGAKKSSEILRLRQYEPLESEAGVSKGQKKHLMKTTEKKSFESSMKDAIPKILKEVQQGCAQHQAKPDSAVQYKKSKEVQAPQHTTLEIENEDRNNVQKVNEINTTEQQKRETIPKEQARKNFKTADVLKHPSKPMILRKRSGSKNIDANRNIVTTQTCKIDLDKKAKAYAKDEVKKIPVTVFFKKESITKILDSKKATQVIEAPAQNSDFNAGEVAKQLVGLEAIPMPTNLNKNFTKNFITTATKKYNPGPPVYQIPCSGYVDKDIKEKEVSKSKRKDHKLYQSMFMEGEENQKSGYIQ